MKRLIVCCDGTWNRADQQWGDIPCPTNVVKLAYRVAKRDALGNPQITLYDQGVGTGNLLDRWTGGVFGAGLEENIYDAYRFLVANYERGDELFLFGFSRGAYTVRSVAGMIRNCGILRRESYNEYRNAILLYRDSKRNPDHPDSVAFRRRHSIGGADTIRIRCIGVWDTVGALGIPLRGLRILRSGEQFHDTELSGSVDLAFQALAVDERRAPFRPAVWAYTPKENQEVRQVWFCGVHSDVGGGYVASGLSDIALEWMLSMARNAGLALEDSVLTANPTRPDPGARVHNSKRGLYLFTPGESRPIGVPTRDSKGDPIPSAMPGGPPVDPTQSLHASVMARWQSDRGYRPPMLREYLRRIGDARAES